MPTYQLKIDAEFLDYPGNPEEAAARFVYELRRADYVIVLVEDEDGVSHEFHV